MAIQIIPANPIRSKSQQFGEAFGKLAQGVTGHLLQNQQQEKAAEALKRITGEDLSGLPPEMQNEVLKQYAKYTSRAKAFQQSGLGKFFGQGQENINEFNEPTADREDLIGPEGTIDIGKVNIKPDFSQTEIPESMIFEAEAMGDHGLANQLKAHNDRIFEEKKIRRKIFEGDRKFHTEFSKKSEEEANNLRTSLPKKEMSLNFARDAVESGETNYFSLNKVADATGIDAFRTAKGAQLITAAKENLLSNMSRVTGRAQNMWFEQRLNSMFPKVGQSKEANLTVQEMLEGELELDKAYLNEFDKIAKRDEQDYGYVKKDISRRAHDAIKPLEKEIMQRTTYRMKEIEEQEKGLKNLKSQVGKNVPKGTPMTLQMLSLYSDKFGDNAIKVAEKNGYYIPTYEEWKRYQ